jgi:hypothetical protein
MANLNFTILQSDVGVDSGFALIRIDLQSFSL